LEYCLPRVMSVPPWFDDTPATLRARRLGVVGARSEPGSYQATVRGSYLGRSGFYETALDRARVVGLAV
jgi:hypothetical protein